MGTGWRRAFCTTIPRDSTEIAKVSEKKQQSASASPSPRSCTKLGFFSNPSTPRLQTRALSSLSLRCKTAILETASASESPRLQCKTTPKVTKTYKQTLGGSNPSSPRSPLKLSLFKNSFKFRSSCRICLNSVKTGQGTAIYTAECAHAFHFPCIASHVRKHGNLVCPVCNTTWKDVPLLAAHKNLNQDDVDSPGYNISVKTKIEEKKMIESSPRLVKTPKKELRIVDSTRYDDDEPLLSPTAAAAAAYFNPIPEADENVQEDGYDVEEFQGFFVNPIPSPSEESCQVQLQSNGRDSRTVQLRLLPESAVISVGQNYETYGVALRIKAPAPAPAPAVRSNKTASHRAPIDLVTVLDLSGSMTWSKLQMLKRAMRLIISSLGPADRLSIVAFSACSKRLLPLRRMTAQGQRAARHIIDRLVCGQGTSVGDALRKATKVLADRRESNHVATIMLLSDGQSERVQGSTGNQRQKESHVSSTRFAHIEIPVHSFGFGRSGGFSHEPAEDAFAKCVGGLLSVVVQDLRIQLSFASGSAPAEISAVYSCSGRPTVLNSGSVRLGDLYAEEERELLVEVRVPTPGAGSLCQASHVMSVKCLYKDPATQEVVYGADQPLYVPCPHSAARSSAPKIERLRSLFISTRATAESRRLIEHNDFNRAHHLLASARALLIHSTSESAEEYVRNLEIELAELHWRRQYLLEQHQHQQQLMTMMQQQRRRGGEKDLAAIVTDENGEPLTPTSAWRAAEKLAKVAMLKKSLNRVSDLHGFENARF